MWPSAFMTLLEVLLEAVARVIGADDDVHGHPPVPARRADATGRRQGQPTGGVARDGAGTPAESWSAITS